MRRFFAVLIGIFAFSVATLAQASLIGDEIEGEYIFYVDDVPQPNIIEPTFAIVGAGVEFAAPVVQDLIRQYDFDTESLWITYSWTSTSIVSIFEHDVWFNDLDWFDDLGNPIEGEIVGFELVSGTAPELIDYGFTADSLHVSFDDIFNQGPRTIMLHFDIHVEHGVPEVPEPATVTLVGLGMAGLAFLRRRVA